jgi:dTDP-4-dehydrorhamnose reductase
MECTLNRVGDRYFDQLERAGHRRRLDDLERFAALGLRTLRYPILWERTAPDTPQRMDWSDADAGLRELHALGLRPIAGLLHHGSGPRYTSLLDPELPGKLAAYARAVAERYPFLDRYTPVNEPLTTARFSGLYGHWYPHATDSLSCMRALVLQCRATALAMRAIRSVNPGAMLIQTEDLGSVRSTPLLGYQAAFENERRWLSFDLLCGRVDPHHPLWRHLLDVGIAEDELLLLRDEPCPPDLIGINYYVTSERFLDENIERYPAWCRGGNGRHAYADVEAVRVCASGTVGLERLLMQAWRRYHIPLAVTEVHLGCSRREQLRWLHQQWLAAKAARAAGADVRAVTAWALLGSFDWDSLVTREAGHYEPGAFDLSRGDRRPTALTRLIRAITSGLPLAHPILSEPGWWQRADRLLYPPIEDGAHEDPHGEPRHLGTPAYAVAA